MNKININLKNKTQRVVNTKNLLTSAQKLFDKDGLKGNINIDYSLVGNVLMQKLNHDFLGHDYVTDVISFPLQQPSQIKKNIGKHPILLGEIIICYNQAKKQAKEKKTSIDEEIEFLFEHGLKHLLGHHHK